MKKLILVLLILAVLVSITGCSSGVVSELKLDPEETVQIEIWPACSPNGAVLIESEEEIEAFCEEFNSIKFRRALLFNKDSVPKAGYRYRIIIRVSQGEGLDIIGRGTNRIEYNGNRYAVSGSALKRLVSVTF